MYWIIPRRKTINSGNWAVLSTVWILTTVVQGCLILNSTYLLNQSRLKICESGSTFGIYIHISSLIKLHGTKTYGGVEVWLHAFLTSALDLGEWSASRHCRFTPRERTRGTDWIGGWVGPRVGLAAAANGIISVPAGNRTSVVQPRSLVTLKFTLFRATKDVTWTFTARSSALLNIS